MNQMFIDAKKYLSYPSLCTFYGTKFKDCHPIMYCGIPLKTTMNVFMKKKEIVHIK